ncbi:MAG: thioesterase family protein [Pseudomonadota bacterium]
MAYSLDDTTEMTDDGAGGFTLSGPKSYWNFIGAFGGWTAALAVKAVIAHPEARGDLVSVTGIFAGAVGEAPISVRPRLQRRHGRADFWRVTISDPAAEGRDAPETAESDPGLLFSADIVMSTPRASEIGYEAPLVASTPLEEVTPPEDLKAMPTNIGPKWLSRYDQRFAEGTPFTRNEHPRSLVWLRETEGRPLDAIGLAAISDSFMPRTFFLDDKMHVTSTVSYGMHVLADAETLLRAGEDFLLMEGSSSGVRNGASDQRGVIRDRAGTVLAVTNQIAFFK